MNHVTAERRQLRPVRGVFPWRRARLGELPGDATDLEHRQRGAVRQNSRHLQENLQPLADRDRRKVVERLGAVASLKQKCLAFGDLAKGCLQLSRLTSKNERGQRF